MKWYVTDMDRINVRIFTNKEKAIWEAKTSVGANKAKVARKGYYEFSTPLSRFGFHRELYVIREDKLKQYGFSDIK